MRKWWNRKRKNDKHNKAAATDIERKQIDATATDDNDNGELEIEGHASRNDRLGSNKRKS